MNGTMETVFVDLGHMTQEGIDHKARTIGTAIVDDVNERSWQ